MKSIPLHGTMHECKCPYCTATLGAVTVSPIIGARNDFPGVMLLPLRPPAENSVAGAIRKSARHTGAKDALGIEKYELLTVFDRGTWFHTGADNEYRLRSMDALALRTGIVQMLSACYHFEQAAAEWMERAIALEGKRPNPPTDKRHAAHPVVDGGVTTETHDYPACALFRGGKCTCDTGSDDRSSPTVTPEEKFDLVALFDALATRVINGAEYSNDERDYLNDFTVLGEGISNLRADLTRWKTIATQRSGTIEEHEHNITAREKERELHLKTIQELSDRVEHFRQERDTCRASQREMLGCINQWVNWFTAVDTATAHNQPGVRKLLETSKAIQAVAHPATREGDSHVQA